MGYKPMFRVRPHAFVVRIWWEQGLSRPNGRPLWRGKVEHAASGQSYVFQSLDGLLRFIQSQTGELEDGLVPNDQDTDPSTRKPTITHARSEHDERHR